MDVLGIFAKYWQPGAVKTRLAAAIGDAAASTVSRYFLEALLDRFAGVADRRVLAFSPRQRQRDFAGLAGPAWELWPQDEGDLGQRMRGFFQQARERGATRTVLIGSDSPDLPGERLASAFQQLRTHRVVLGPAADGGYCLLGVSGAIPDLFSGIAWSTAEVCRETERRLQSQNLNYAILPRWYDVDELPDLQRMLRRLRRSPTLAPALRRLRQSLDSFEDTPIRRDRCE